MGSGRCPPPRRLAARGRRGGGAAPPRSGPLEAACAGERCPAPSSAPTADQRPALTDPRVRRWARGVAPSTFRRHRRLRRSARGRRESLESRSTGRPRRDALCTCARCMVCRSWVGKSVSRRGSAGGRMGQGARPSRSVSRAMRRTCCVWLLLVSARHFPHSILILYSRGSLSAEICWFGSQHARHACDLGRATDCDDQGVQHGPHALRTAFHSCGLG